MEREWEGYSETVVPSPEGARLPSRLLDPGGGPRPLLKRSPAVRGRPALPVVAQPGEVANALGHPGEPGAGLLGAEPQGVHRLS